MAGISTADHKAESLDDLRSRWRFSVGRIKTDPNAAPYLADFEAFGPKWALVDHTEMAKEDAVSDAEAAAVTADGRLDDLSRQVSSAIFAGKKVDATLPLATVYFGGLSPSEFVRPRLGKQLVGMTAWPDLLAKATQPALLSLVPAAAVIPAAATAAKTLSTAIADRDLFHDGGERKALFDAFNALCSTAYGGLKAFVHQHPELDLPAGYAESFFKQGPVSTQPKTLGEANALVERLENKLGKAKTLQSEMEKKAAEHEAEVEAHKKALADEAAAKKAVADALKAKKEAEAAAKKTKPKK